MDAGDIVEAVLPESSDPLDKGFEYGKRKHQDVCFTVFYSVLMIFSGGVGIFAFFNRNDEWRQLYKQDYLTDRSFCLNDTAALVLTAGSLGQDAAEAALEELSSGSFMQFLDHAFVWLLSATAGAIVLGFVFLLLFSFFAIGMVYFTVCVIVAVPVVAGVYEFFKQEEIYGGILLGVALILILAFMCLRTKLNMVAKLLDSAADGVRENLGLVFFTLCTMVLALCFIAALAACGILAYSNGQFVYNASKISSSGPKGCFDAIGASVECCVYDVEDWVIPYYVLLAFMALWNVFLLSQIRVYVVSGTIAQWYFADEGDIKVKGKIGRSLGHALGPSFGSICLSSIIITIGSIIRKMAEYMKNEKKTWFWWLVNCCVQGIISLLEFLTEFATVHMAITGESFWESGKDTVQMLKRNFINAYTVWWVPPIILGLTGIILSGSISIVLGTSAYFTWDEIGDEFGKDVQTKYSVFLGLCSFGLMLLVISFFSLILLDTVSAVFVCFAMDRDNKKETRHKIHEVMAMMPSVGAVDKGGVEKRDRALPYEAPPMV